MRAPRWLAAAVAAGLLAALPGLAAGATAPLVEQIATFHGSLARTGYTPTGIGIDRSDLTRLALEWEYPSTSVISAQPTVVGSVVYWGNWSGDEYATTAAGENLWSTNLGTTVDRSCDPDEAGVASTAAVGTVGGSPRVFVGGGAANVVSLDATTGAVLWDVRIGPLQHSFVWDSPALYDGSVYLGLSSFGDCPLVRGRVIRLDAATGAQLASNYLVTKSCRGAGVWSSPAIDAAAGVLYVTTGNASCTTPLQNAVLELNSETLRVESSWQIPPADWVSDSDWGSTPTLFAAEIGGRSVAMVGSAAKNGVFYALERASLSRGPAWTYRVAAGGDCPQCGDGSISPAAFDGARLFVAGGRTTVGANHCGGSVDALAPATGTPIWRDCFAGAILGPLTEVPGVVFATPGDELVGLDTATGATLFRFTDPDRAVFYGGATVEGNRLVVGDTAGNLFQFALTG